jgi:hypothetical protein
MIPNLSYPGILTPLNLDPQPLLDQDAVLLQFDSSNAEHQVLHFDQNVLKPSIVTALITRGLLIEKVDVWRWNLDKEKDFTPHSDGDGTRNGRRVGINWNLLADDSGVEFYDTNQGAPIFEEVPDGRSHTLWTFPPETKPLVVWKSRWPSLINTQVPHRVTGPAGAFRYSVTLKIGPNTTYRAIQSSLWDLRADYDFWSANINSETIEQISNIVTRLENSITIPEGNLVAYNLPTNINLLKIFYKFCKKPIKSFRVFKYKGGARANLHIDYDATVKQSPAYALNIPLYGSNNSEIIFYKNMGKVKEINDNETGSRLVPTDDSLVYRNSSLSITTPHLIRTNIPHEVRIHDNSDRKVLSVRFIDSELDNPTEILSNIRPKFD